MTARDRARMRHWDVDPKRRHERDPAGIIMQEEIKRWNAEARQRHARWLALAAELKLKK